MNIQEMKVYAEQRAEYEYQQILMDFEDAEKPSRAGFKVPVDNKAKLVQWLRQLRIQFGQ